jgi:CO/xanthine dehydrogenase Mo-binding subunit
MSGDEAPQVRPDAYAKVTGEALFTGDLSLPDMLHLAVVRSPYPHARIRFIESSSAFNSADVVDVITFDDLRDLDPWFGNIAIDRPILAANTVRFEGEPVALVVATSQRAARAAAAAVHVGYEELPTVDTIDAGLAGYLPLHTTPARPGGISGIRVEAELEHNICHRHHRVRGDVDLIPEDALVLERTFQFPAVYQYALEPHTALARWNKGRLDVWSSAQHPYAVRRELARIFDLPLSSVRLAVPYVGGGFGSKSWTKIEPLVAVASWRVGAPVRLALRVSEAMRTSRRHNAEITVRSVFSPDGRLYARKVRALFDTGAYTDNGPQVVTSALDSSIAPYFVENFDLEAVAVFTNTPPAGSMRAIGAPQVNWGCEAQLDEAADMLGLTPFELRRRNLAAPGVHVFDGLTPVDANLHASLECLQEHVATSPALSVARSGSAVGRGMGMAMTGAGASPVSVAWIRLHADGSLTTHCGSTEIGQGSRVALRRIVARRLGVPDARVELVPSDSRSSPYDQSTGASRTTTVAGTAVLAAADDLLEQLRHIAADLADVRPGDVEVGSGCARWDGGAATYADLIVHYFGSPAGELLGRGYSGRRVPSSLGSTTPIFWEIALGSTDVEVDRLTGEVRVLRYTAVSDVGEPIHPPSVRGQECGAVMMGIGHTLFEEMHLDRGRLRDDSLAGYRVPSLADLPDEIVTAHVANQDGPGPFGARGVGEASVVPVAASIVNALYDATGVRFGVLPLTPERVWRALQDTELSDHPGTSDPQ